MGGEGEGTGEGENVTTGEAYGDKGFPTNARVALGGVMPLPLTLVGVEFAESRCLVEGSGGKSR